MASYKSTHKSTKMKSKFYSDISTRRSSEKPKKDKTVTALTKVVVRRLPPSMTEELFIESVSPLPEHDYFAFINADSSLGSSAYSRAYISFKSVDDVYTFRDKFDGYVFVDQKGNEHPAMVEYAPFQKIPKRTASKKKDARCGTIDEDADYLAFLEALTKPVTITLPPLEAVLEEIQAHDRELKANNGLIKVKTPLLEFIEQRKAEKLRSKEEKKEERRRKEFERKKAREEERKKKKEVRDHHREMKKEHKDERDQHSREMKKELKDEREHHRDVKKEQKDDSSVKVLRPERGKEEYSSDVRHEKSRGDREKERQKREEERLKVRKEKEKLRREKEKEERLRRLEDKSKYREEEKSRQKEEPVDDWQEEKLGNKPEGSKSKRYSEGRRKEREKEKVKEEKDKEKKCKDEPEDVEVDVTDDKKTEPDRTVEKEESEPPPKKEEKTEEKPAPRKRREKDPRVERRIRNKDRPAMALYRPGQSRLSSRMRQDREEGAETSSSSPSPVMPAEQKKSCQSQKENMDSSRSDYKEDESSKAKDDSTDSNDVSSSHSKEVDEGKNSDSDKFDKGIDSEWLDIESSTKSKDTQPEKKQETEDDIDVRDGAYSCEGMQDKSDDGMENASGDAKKFPGVKSMTFRRSVSRE